MTDAAYHGIDIGGSKIELVAYTSTGAGLIERHRQRVATPSTDFTAFIEAVRSLVADADAAIGSTAQVGIGLPGVIDSVSGRQISSNLPALNGRLVTEALETALRRPIAIGNDCQCFALSEAQGGAAHGLPSMFGAILGTGAGGGFCVDGKLRRGLNGVAGEWGHWSLPPTLLAEHGLPVLPCPCGLKGCIERYVSGPGMANLYRHLTGEAAEPLAIVGRSLAGDTDAARALALHIDLLGHALAAVVLALDPHAIVLGGGLSKLGHLYRALPPAMDRHLFRGVHVPPILPPAFGDAGGARGAALLAKQQSQSA